MSTNWWNIIPNTQCLFALDYNSQINPEGTEIIFTNKNGNKATSKSKIKGGFYKSTVTQFKGKDYSYLLDKYYTYRAIRLEKSVPVLSTPILIPDDATIVLVCRFIGGSQLMGRGVAWRVKSPHSNLYNYTWKVDEPSSTKRPSIFNQFDERFREAYSSNIPIESVAFRLKKSERLIKVKSSFGDYELDGGNFLSTRYSDKISTLGPENNYESELPDVYIIAYGMFDRQLTDDELQTIFNKIDEEFLVEEIPLNMERTENGLKWFDVSPDTQDLTPIRQVKFLSDIKGVISTSSDTKVKDTTIKEYGIISDYVYEEEEPTETKLFLINRDTGAYIATTYSNKEGYFEFKNIDKTLEYLVVAPHLNYQFRAIVKDYLPTGV